MLTITNNNGNNRLSLFQLNISSDLISRKNIFLTLAICCTGALYAAHRSNKLNFLYNYINNLSKFRFNSNSSANNSYTRNAEDLVTAENIEFQKHPDLSKEEKEPSEKLLANKEIRQVMIDDVTYTKLPVLGSDQSQTENQELNGETNFRNNPEDEKQLDSEYHMPSKDEFTKDELKSTEKAALDEKNKQEQNNATNNKKWGIFGF